MPVWTGACETAACFAVYILRMLAQSLLPCPLLRDPAEQGGACLGGAGGI